MYETIVVPTDGSEFSVRAAEQAREIATAFDATVHVLTVVDEDAATSVYDRAEVTADLREALRADGEDAIDRATTVLSGLAAVETALVEGQTTESILGYVDDVDADLLVMGTHGRTGVDRYVAGSVTERVLRRSDVPVFTVRKREISRGLDEYDSVLLPTDGSPAAEAAVDHALAIATVGDATVHVVHVVDIVALAGSSNTSAPADALESVTQAGQHAVDRVAERARDAGLVTDTAVLKGSPGHMLLEYGEDEAVDLIVMATTGRTGLDRYLLGSTTERLIRHAERPVLAVPARDGES